MKPAVSLLVILLGVCPAFAATRYLPSLRFRVVTTPHFFIYFHQREEDIARRFAVLAEEVHAELTARLRVAPMGRTHVILVDQHDVANGWATPLPYNAIEVTVAPPAPREFIGNTDDWLRIVFVHEYTHILQLDRSRGFASVARGILGRSPLAFPNLALPAWQIEGLATFEESVVTGRGRVHAGDFARLVDEAALGGRALSLGRASSLPDRWPAGQTPYAYGAFFYQYLAERFGDEKVAELQQRTAGEFYFLGSRAFKDTFGPSLGELWKAFETARASSAIPGGAGGRRLTSRGFMVTGPRFVTTPSGRTEIVYSSKDADDFPSLMAVTLDGRSRRLASRSAGAEVSAASGALVFDQLDLARSVALRSDLYALDLATGRVSRLTSDARFQDAAVSPRGDRLACVAIVDGARHLAVFDLPAGAWPGDISRLRQALRKPARLHISGADIEYASPRWSPDGRFVAISRIERHGPSEIVVVDASSGQVTPLVSTRDHRLVTPAWAPDGRTLFFASDRGGPFNLYAMALERGDAGAWRPGPLFQVTDFPSGATYPDVSPDGQSLVYVGYTAAGYDVFLLPIDRASWQPAGGFDDRRDANDRRDAGPTTAAEPPPYRPWSTLLPRYWLPAWDMRDEQVKIGAQTSGSDVLGRHVWAAAVVARVAGKAGAPGSPRYDWAATYAYDRWRPAFWLGASDQTHYLADIYIAQDTLAPADIRDEDYEAGVRLPDAHLQWTQSWSASFDVQRRTRRVGPCSATRDRNGVRLSWQLSTTKTYPYSISPEQGVRAGVAGEIIRSALGADGNAAAFMADVRGYLRLGGRHAILAVRAGVGVAGGPGPSREFYLGGSGPNAALVDFSSDTLSLLRGREPDYAYWGSHVLVSNVEYRVPLLRVERGIGTLPVFLRTVHAAAFLDVGKTWFDDYEHRGFARGAGFEIGADLRLAYRWPLTVMVGVAWPHDPFRLRADLPPVAYLRLNRAF